jgi:hypothetical protein
VELLVLTLDKLELDRFKLDGLILDGLILDGLILETCALDTVTGRLLAAGEDSTGLLEVEAPEAPPPQATNSWVLNSIPIKYSVFIIYPLR